MSSEISASQAFDWNEAIKLYQIDGKKRSTDDPGLLKCAIALQEFVWIQKKKDLLAIVMKILVNPDSNNLTQGNDR